MRKVVKKMRKFYLLDKKDEARFIVNVNDYGTHYVGFQVDEVHSWSRKGEVLDSEHYLEGSIKWDTCCHFFFGEKDNAGYIHMCGITSFYDHIALLKSLNELAFDLMDDDIIRDEEWEMELPEEYLFTIKEIPAEEQDGTDCCTLTD